MIRSHVSARCSFIKQTSFYWLKLCLDMLEIKYVRYDMNQLIENNSMNISLLFYYLFM